MVIKHISRPSLTDTGMGFRDPLDRCSADPEVGSTQGFEHCKQRYVTLGSNPESLVTLHWWQRWDSRPYGLPTPGSGVHCSTTLAKELGVNAVYIYHSLM